MRLRLSFRKFSLIVNKSAGKKVMALCLLFDLIALIGKFDCFDRFAGIMISWFEVAMQQIYSSFENTVSLICVSLSVFHFQISISVTIIC
jgi:hypothetical protein